MKITNRQDTKNAKKRENRGFHVSAERAAAPPRRVPVPLNGGANALHEGGA